MDELQIFKNASFGEVRVVEHNGEPWFVGSDVAKVLGYADPSRAVVEHCKKQKKSTILVNNQHGKTTPLNQSIIPEYDVYRLVMRSSLPKAVEFQDWICDEVIPSIRKTGGYGVNHAIPDFSNPAAAARAWADEYEARMLAQATVEVQKPLVRIAETRIDKKGCFSITDVNKSLGLKRGVVTNWAKSNGYLHQKLSEVNKAGEKYFKVYSSDGVHNQIGITEEGLQLIKRHFTSDIR